MSIESERMKIELVSNYITSAYLNMAIFLVTTLVVVFAVLLAALLAALLAYQLELVQVAYIGVPLEVLDFLAIVGQNGKFERRLEHLDTLIKNTESTPPIPLGSVKDMIRDIRRK